MGVGSVAHASAVAVLATDNTVASAAAAAVAVLLKANAVYVGAGGAGDAGAGVQLTAATRANPTNDEKIGSYVRASTWLPFASFCRLPFSLGACAPEVQTGCSRAARQVCGNSQAGTTDMHRDFPYWESSGSRGSPNEIVAA